MDIELLMIEVEERMEKTISTLENNLLKVRTGRANPKMLDIIEADYYGSPTLIKQIASISVQEGGTFFIKHFYLSTLKEI